MPKKLEECIAQVKKKIENGEMPKGSNAWAICVKSTGLKPHKAKKRPKSIEELRKLAKDSTDE